MFGEECEMYHRTKMMSVVLLSGMLALCAAAGCAGSRTTKTTQTVRAEEPALAPDTDEARQARSAPTTVTTTTTTESDSPGIVGSAFRLVWAVVSFPFRVIGALF
jgi:ABC-type phosphate transport system substrate-binding protein